MELRIREAQPNDAAGIIRVLNPIIESGLYSALDMPLIEEQEREFIANFPHRGVFHVAERVDNQTIAGIQDIAPFGDGSTRAFDHVGVIATFVDLSLRRRGISKRLFQSTLDAARHKGFEKLFTCIRADNSAAVAAYLSNGFRKIGIARKHARVGGKLIDEVLVERFL